MGDERRTQRGDWSREASVVRLGEMANLHKSVASLRISGDALDPREISLLLGCEPTFGHRKGEIIRHAQTGRERTARSGMWLLESQDREPGNLDGQVSEILSKLTGD